MFISPPEFVLKQEEFFLKIYLESSLSRLTMQVIINNCVE